MHKTLVILFALTSSFIIASLEAKAECDLNLKDISLEENVITIRGETAYQISRRIPGYEAKLPFGLVDRFGYTNAAVSCKRVKDKLTRKRRTYCEIGFGSLAADAAPVESRCQATDFDHLAGKLLFSARRASKHSLAQQLHQWLPEKTGYRGFASKVSIIWDGILSVDPYSLICRYSKRDGYYCKFKTPCGNKGCAIMTIDIPVRISVVQANRGTFAP